MKDLSIFVALSGEEIEYKSKAKGFFYEKRAMKAKLTKVEEEFNNYKSMYQIQGVWIKNYVNKDKEIKTIIEDNEASSKQVEDLVVARKSVENLTNKIAELELEMEDFSLR